MRLGFLDHHLNRNEYLLSQFSVTDAYLTVVMNWAAFVKLGLGDYPAIATHLQRTTQRSSVSHAIDEKTAMFEARKR